MGRSRAIGVYFGEALERYGFGEDHPFRRERIHAFWDEVHRRHLDFQVRVLDPVMATEAELLSFHTPEHVARVRAGSERGEGSLDYGDTPAYPGVYEAAGHVVGSTLDAVRRIMDGELRRCFVPIAGLHHGMPDTAGGFCVFNDCGVAIRALQQAFGLERIAYVDIDAHHGDGVFYPFEADPTLIFADIHEDGRYIFPQTGSEDETGTGEAEGRKLNIPLLPLSGDREFMAAWERILAFLESWRPQFVLMQCGADGLNGDPLAHLHYSPRVHARAARDLCRIAEAHAGGRILGMGGGGYDLQNLAKAWTAVVHEFLEAPIP